MGNLSIPKFFGFVLCTLLSVALYYDTLSWLYSRYIAADSYYSHGFLIPLVSAFLIWGRREPLRSVPPELSRLGLWIVIASLLLHVVGTLVHFYFVSGLSLLLFVFSATLFLFGWGVTRLLLFPLLYLAFMVPLPLPTISAILYPMKILVVKAASRIIGLMGVPIHVEGFNVSLPNGTLVVGNPCSGLRSLIAFLAMGALIAHTSASSRRNWLLVFLMSAPIAIFSNITRTVSLIMVANKWGTKAASPEHWFHDTSGLAVFALGLVLLLFVTKVLKWKSSETASSC
jgi:exosortase